MPDTDPIREAEDVAAQRQQAQAMIEAMTIFAQMRDAAVAAGFTREEAMAMVMQAIGAMFVQRG